jgi:peptidoglycan/LPS O-acetylase OafA/YrhL
MVIFGFAWVLFAVEEPRMVRHAGFAFLYGGLMVIALAPENELAPVLSSRLLLWMGERSYSLFLIHFTAFYLVNYLTSYIADSKNLTYLIITRIGGFLVAFLLAMLMFQFIERRFARNLVTADQFWPPILGGKRPIVKS